MEPQTNARGQRPALGDGTQTSKTGAGSLPRTSNLTRRAAFKLLMGAGAFALAPRLAPATALAVDHSGVEAAQDALDDAQAKYKEVEDQLDKLGNEYEQLAEQQAATLDKIEAKQAEIDAKQAEIDELQKKIDAKQAEIDKTQASIDQLQADIEEKEAQLQAKQEALAARVSSAYKSGGNDFLSVVMSSSSFEELTSNIYYLDKISQSDAQMIADVKQVKAELADQKAQLEDQKAVLQQEQAEIKEQQDELKKQQDVLKGQKAELDALNAKQEQQLASMKAKQDEVQKTLDGLSDEVAKLVDKRDAEVVAYNKARQEEAAAAAAAASSGSAGAYAAGIARGGGEQHPATGSQQAVVNATSSVGSPGHGYCAMWVSLVFQRAGYGYIGGDANDMYAAYCHSSDKNNLKVGMIIAVSTHNRTRAGRIYGHVGIYVGNGIVKDNIGYIRSMNVDDWIARYATTVTPRWGWAGGVVLS